jgi:hypothetical protein
MVVTAGMLFGLNGTVSKVVLASGLVPGDQEYGDRRYHARPGGQEWFFAQRIRDLTPDGGMERGGQPRCMRKS